MITKHREATGDDEGLIDCRPSIHSLAAGSKQGKKRTIFDVDGSCRPDGFDTVCEETIGVYA